MPLVASSLPNLVGGVSQQPAALRLSSAAQAMENAWPSMVSGNQKRPASVFVNKPAMTISGGVSGYLIERDPTYRYAVILTNGDLKVLNLNTGALETVTFPNGKTYLNATSPVDSFRYVTVGDYTFIANRNVVVGSSSVSEPVGGATRLDPTTMATFQVTQTNANSYYSIYFNSTKVAEYLTPDGTTASTAVPDTGVIAQELANDLIAAGYTVVKTGSTITVTNLGATVKIATQANTGDKSLKGFRDSVQQFSDLPPSSPPGRIVKVAGDPKEGGDDYYVIFNNGVWTETIAYGAGSKFDAATMPHVLVRNSDGTWTFKNHVWTDKAVGGVDSNKIPSFVGFAIGDIFVHQNRLGFLADENIIMSEADTYENFWRTSVAAVMDSDRIDIAVLNTGVEILNSAVAYNRDLLICSETAQFRFSYQNYLSAKTAQVKFTTAFNMSKRIKPINMGNSIYFVDDRADYSFLKVWEYFPKDLAVSDDADDATAACPEYIPYDCTFFAGSNRSKAAVLSTASAPSTLFFYKFFWNGDKKIQTAWHKWTFADCVKIHWGGFAGTDFFMLIERSDGLHLEKITFDEDVFDTNLNYHVLLDRRSTPLSTSYNATTGKTTITLRWSTTAPVEVVSSSSTVHGYRHAVTKVNANTVTVFGDITAEEITVGVPYTWLYEFSPMYMRQQKGGGDVVILDGRLQMRYVAVEYHNTAAFKVSVKLPGRDAFETIFNGNTVGSDGWTLGTQSFASGKFRIPVMGKNTDIVLKLTNDTPFPSAFGTAEWQGVFSPKAAQRV